MKHYFISKSKVFPNDLQRMDGRWIMVLIVVCFFGILNLEAITRGGDIGHVLFSFGVPNGQTFQDFKAIADGMNVFNAAGRSWYDDTISLSINKFSYPRWWLGAAYLGLNIHSYYKYSVGVIILFYTSVFFLLGRIGFLEGVFAGLILISPAVMTGIERCNADLIIFCLMTLALMLRRVLPFAFSMVTLAGALKFYPAAGLFVFCFPPWRRTLPWLVAAVVVLLLSVIICLKDIHQINEACSLVNPLFSFGIAPVLINLENQLSHNFSYTHLRIMGGLMLIILLCISVWVHPVVISRPDWEREITAFKIGASLYIGTFMLGCNFDYRMIVVIFCFPLLFILGRKRNTASCWTIISLCLIFSYVYTNVFLGELTYWYSPSETGFYFKQFLSWGLAACLAALYASLIGSDRAS